MIEYMEHITRDYIRKNPHKIFLFGDNLQHQGFGGQAKEMRGEPNAIGIPTKKKPSMTENSFFTDDEYEENIRVIDSALMNIFIKAERNPIVVIPKSGLGTGLAELQTRAPNTYQHLINRLKEFEAI